MVSGDVVRFIVVKAASGTGAVELDELELLEELVAVLPLDEFEDVDEAVLSSVALALPTPLVALAVSRELELLLELEEEELEDDCK